MNVPVLLLAPVALLTACATLPAHPVEGPARLGQTAYVGGPTVRPVKVIEDSRCPANVRCIWAGRLVLRTEVRTGRAHRTVDLTLGDAGAPIADGHLLVSVTPEKYGKPIPRGQYRFGFEFQGGI